MGLVGACGVLFALFYSLTLLPALLTVLPVHAITHIPNASGHILNNILQGCAPIATSYPRAICLAGLCVFIVTATGLPRLYFSHDPLAWLPEHNVVRQATSLVNEQLGGVINLEIDINVGKNGA